VESKTQSTAQESYKKNETAGETFKLDLPKKVKETISEKDPESEKVRLFFQAR